MSADPLQALSDAVDDLQAAARCVAKLQAARAAFVLGKDGAADPAAAATYAFFASLVLRCELVRRDDVKTMATDGRMIMYAVPYVDPLTAHQTVSELAHETLHNVLQHPARLAEVVGPAPDQAKIRRAQVAADCAVDPIARDAGFWNPPGAVFPAQYDLPEGQSFEWYFRHLPADAGEGADGDAAQHGQAQPACGDDGAPDAAAAQAQAAEWRVAVEQARRAAALRGTLPGALAELCDAAMAPRVDWRAMLREFFNAVSRDDYSWSRPNRRHVAAGLYLPSCYSERLGRLVVVVDTSGSVSDAAVAAGLGEVRAILEERPMAVDLLLHDSSHYATHAIDVAAGDDFPAIATKRGGTSHREACAWIKANADDAVAALFFTDCESDLDRVDVPACPSLFFTPSGCTTPAPSWAAVRVELPDA